MGPALVSADEAGYKDKLAAAASARDTTPADLETKWLEMGLPIGSSDRAQSIVADLEAVGVDLMYAHQLEMNELDAMADMFSALRG